MTPAPKRHWFGYLLGLVALAVSFWCGSVAGRAVLLRQQDAALSELGEDDPFATTGPATDQQPRKDLTKDYLIFPAEQDFQMQSAPLGTEPRPLAR